MRFPGAANGYGGAWTGVMPDAVRTYYLEMTSPEELRPSQRSGADIALMRVEIPCPAFNRFLYTTVGDAWQWMDRRGWTEEQWRDYLDRAELETWVGYVRGAPAGYFELEKQVGGAVEIVYFGLLPQFIGQGLGGQLLTRAIERAWAWGASRVWVHTCSLDHPSALRNYQARGLRLYREETEKLAGGD